MKQVKGQFGYSSTDSANELRSFSPAIAFGKDGSIDTQSIIYWVENVLCALYPDAEDVAGKRVMMKADMGPGRFDVNFRAISRSYGFYFFAGLPNGTELGQEMDQLFAYVKTVMEVNREDLWKARYAILRQKARTHTRVLPWIVFGGKVKLANGTVLELRNAFNQAFTPSRLQRATEKCGYVPATRALLNSEILLREVSDETAEEGIQDNDDSGKTTHAQMMKDIEHRNLSVKDTSWQANSNAKLPGHRREGSSQRLTSLSQTQETGKRNLWGYGMLENGLKSQMVAPL